MPSVFKFIPTFILFMLAFSLFGFYWAIRPIKITSHQTPGDFGLPWEKVTFATEDGITLRGWFIPNKNPKAPTLILLHGYPADKGNILPFRQFLHQKYNLLFFDFRYLGESDGYYSTAGKKEVLDLRAAIHYLHQRHIDAVGVWGFSLGGAVALMAAPSAPEIKAIIAESPYASLDRMAYDHWPIPLLKYPLGELLRFWVWLFLGFDIKTVSPLDSAAQLDIPVLVIHSRHDAVISSQQAELFRSALGDKKNIQFLWLDDASHGEIFQGYEKIAGSFFNEQMPGA